MPVERRPMSVSQCAELLGVDAEQFVDLEVNRLTSTVVLVVEPVMTQVTGTFPQIADNQSRTRGDKTMPKGKGYGKASSAKYPTKGSKATKK